MTMTLNTWVMAASATVVTVVALVGVLLTMDISGMEEDVRRREEREEEMRHQRKSLPPGKVLFEPTDHWQTVHDNHILPPGLFIRMNVTTGAKEAKLNTRD